MSKYKYTSLHAKIGISRSQLSEWANDVKSPSKLTTQFMDYLALEDKPTNYVNYLKKINKVDIDTSTGADNIITKICHKFNISQRQLGTITGTHQVKIGEYARGDRKMSRANMAAFKAILHSDQYTLDEIFDGVPDQVSNDRNDVVMINHLLNTLNDQIQPILHKCADKLENTSEIFDSMREKLSILSITEDDERDEI